MVPDKEQGLLDEYNVAKAISDFIAKLAHGRLVMPQDLRLEVRKESEHARIRSVKAEWKLAAFRRARTNSQ